MRSAKRVAQQGTLINDQEGSARMKKSTKGGAHCNFSVFQPMHIHRWRQRGDWCVLNTRRRPVLFFVADSHGFDQPAYK